MICFDRYHNARFTEITPETKVVAGYEEFLVLEFEDDEEPIPCLY